MTKSTVAVILVSVASLPPWGDDGWRFAGAMQLVHDGPDWLYAQWPSLDGQEQNEGRDRYASLVLRDQADQRAADIAAMSLALAKVPEWPTLSAWWDPNCDRNSQTRSLREVAQKYAGQYKLAVVQTALGVEADVLRALQDLGFQVVEFTAA